MSKNEGAQEDVLEDLPIVKDGEEDKTDYKALAAKNHSIAQRYKTKAEKAGKSGDESADGKSEKSGKQESSDGLTVLDKAVLRVEKITDPAEVELVKSIMKESGKDIDTVLGMKYFQAELKELRELKATEDATPSGDKKRSSAPARDSVDYWLAKGELPPADQRELRTKVVNARMAKEKNKNQFSNNPIS